MKTIIVPTDFSPIAVNAMNYAIDMAKSINASLLLLHVYQVPVTYTDIPVVMISVDDIRKGAEEKLERVKNEVEHVTSGTVKVYTEARMGNVADELEDLCSKISPFAVVMGTKGHSGLDRILFGSNTLAAIKHLTWPVICVPPGKEYGNGIKQVGFACDFKEVVKTTPVSVIKNFVQEFKATLHVLNTDFHNKQFKPETPEESILLHTMLEDAKPVYHFIQHHDIEDGINQFAEENNLDMIIAIPKKHKLLEGLFKPSTTRQLVFQSHVPVLCVHE
ncbi:MAG: universal stress protein [Bacteroidetes bacterium]|nr:universal stress protein [Bacteroidota bacterium]